MGLEKNHNRELLTRSLMLFMGSPCCAVVWPGRKRRAATGARKVEDPEKRRIFVGSKAVNGLTGWSRGDERGDSMSHKDKSHKDKQGRSFILLGVHTLSRSILSRPLWTLFTLKASNVPGETLRRLWQKLCVGRARRHKLCSDKSWPVIRQGAR